MESLTISRKTLKSLLERTLVSTEISNYGGKERKESVYETSVCQV